MSDDNELITEEWLESIGFHYDDEWERRYIHGLPNVAVMHCEEDGTDFHIGDWVISEKTHPKTRGDVRDWLRALKVPMKGEA